jgi:hypothetical protein
MALNVDEIDKNTKKPRRIPEMHHCSPYKWSLPRLINSNPICSEHRGRLLLIDGMENERTYIGFEEFQ